MALDDEDLQRKFESILARRQERLGISREEALKPSAEPSLLLEAEERRARESGCEPDELLRRDLQRMRELPYPGPDCLQPDEVMSYAETRELPADRLTHAERCLECGALLRHAVLRPPELPREQSVPAAAPRRWAPPVWSPALVAACMLLAIGLFQWLAPLLHKPLDHTDYARIFVLSPTGDSLRKATDEVPWINAACSQVVSAKLSRVSSEHRIAVEPWDQAADLSLAVADSDLTAIPSLHLQTLKHGLGADALVLCSGRIEPRRVLLTMEIAQDGHPEKQSFAAANMAGVPDLAYQAGQWALERLGLGAASPPRGQSARYAMPANAEAFRDFSAGLALRAGGQPAEAVRPLQAALRHEEHPLVYAALADVWSRLGDAKSERQSIEAALQRADHYPLPKYERKALEGQYSVAFARWKEAAEVYSDLEERSPNPADSSIRLAETYLATSDARSTLDKVTELRKAKLSDLDKARLNLLEAKAADILGDPGRQQRTALDAAATGRRLGARHLEAEASLLAGRALRDQNAAQSAAESASLFQRAWDLSREIGDADGCATVRLEQGISAMLVERDAAERAERLLREALTSFAENGNRGGVAKVQIRLGHLDDMHNHAGEAKAHYETALQTFTDLGDRRGTAQARLSLGILHWNRFRNLAAAERDFAAALEQAQEISDRADEARVLVNQGQLLFERGKVAEARETLEKSLDIRKKAGLRSDEAASRAALAEVLVYEDELSAAEEQDDAALSVYEKIKGARSPETARVRLRRAAVWLEQERLDAVDSELAEIRRLAGLPKALKEYDLPLVLAQLRLLQGKPEEARSALPPPGDASRELVAARIDIAAGQRAAAVARLQPIVRVARTQGLALLELEARLALAEAQLQDHNDTAREELQAIRRQAKEKGATILARKATDLLRGKGSRLSNSVFFSLFPFKSKK